MLLHLRDAPISWPEPGLPFEAIGADWFGAPLKPAPEFALGLDPDHLWLCARHKGSPMLHPRAEPGACVEGLWEFDVAELFIADPQGPAYLEFNLSPNGAWWACAFEDVRRRRGPLADPAGKIRSFGEIGAHGWAAALAVPRPLLVEQIGFGTSSPLNVTMILRSPQPQFASAADLGDGDPDYHRPARFAAPKWVQ